MSEIKNNGKVIDIEETKESKLKAKVSKVGQTIKANRKKIIVASAMIVGAAVGVYLIKNKLNVDVEVMRDADDAIDVTDYAEVIAEAE